MDYQHTDGVPFLVLDLETAPLPEAADFIEEQPYPEMPALDKRFTDPVKVEADRVAKTAQHAGLIAKWIQERKDALNACALNCDLGQITAVGYDAGQGVVVHAQDSMTEAEIVRLVGSQIGPATLCCGFNLRFDLAFLMRRALYLGVPFPAIGLGKYRATFCDLQDVLTFEGYLGNKGRSLAFYKRRFKLDVPDDPTGGGEAMPALFAAGDWAAIRTHCELDVQTTMALAKRLGVIKPPVGVF
jgi:hypothetical protein